ncbi:helix-turn-helix domain-containing protein [Campylobacter hominis]|uniref:helix-turn-helix domain-containing protein n=1 Tax=Campylobacter hominis TaxID=76517 RepID=UPI0023F053EF|nr:DNA-binding protein [Campylobacter hominis]MDD7421949.1 DNA-binding protein [Campylobacter hominis]MDY3117504.1 DNA-binding protein [Campylobacter hominis]
MQKLSVAEAAKKLGVSKEAIYNRIRRNKLKTTDEDGVRFVIFDDDEPILTKQTKKISNSDGFIDYLLQEIAELKAQISDLNEQKDELFHQKEEILIANKNEIKQMYKERDEKLSYFLSFFEKPLLGIKQTPDNDKTKDEALEIFPDDDWVSIGEYLRAQKLSHKKIIKARKIIIKNIGKTPLIKIKNDILLVHKELDIAILKQIKKK